MRDSPNNRDATKQKSRVKQEALLVYCRETFHLVKGELVSRLNNIDKLSVYHSCPEITSSLNKVMATCSIKIKVR